MLSERIEYVPTLAIRPSEMNGLEQLPGLTKQHMKPVFLVAPWTSANSLEKAVGRAEKAYPAYSYYLDLDRDYAITNPEAEAQQQLIDLFSPRGGYKNWWKFVGQFVRATPCLQLRDQSKKSILRQIARAQEFERGFGLRINLSRFPENLADVVGALNEIGSADYSIILEGGWVPDALSIMTRMSGIIGSALGDIEADVPIIVSCTSIPKQFHGFSGCHVEKFSNRMLVEQVARNHNRRRVVYGDWGSTRPRESGEHRRRPHDRIDYPREDEWIIARSREEKWDFRDAADAIVHRSGYWDEEVAIWGTNMILRTLANPRFGINTPQKNVAARVNIHLHRQALYGRKLQHEDFDEPWQD